MSYSPLLFNYYCNSYIPVSGQAETVQGEILRNIVRLFDEYFRNGNANWDNGFEIMSNYLEEVLISHDKFSDEIKEEVKKSVFQIKNAKNNDIDIKYFDFLADRVTEFCDNTLKFGSQPIPRQFNNDLNR